ncbi:MAG: hypothetical protein K6A23_11140 [Butyrivibrio sp.]|nr:hypothetical protein [Butyrivibrio sp.]
MKNFSKKTIVVRAAAAVLGAAFAITALPAGQAQAAAYSSKYTTTYSWEELILPALKKQTDVNGVYRQLKLSLQYGTLNEGNIRHLYEQSDVNIQLEVILKLYQDGLVSSYLYKDLANLPMDALDLAPIFNADYYYSANPDLQAVIGNDPARLFEHFVTYGMNEGRVASSTFNINCYKNNYPAIVAEYGANNASYYDHYMAYGRFEGRVANKNK